MLIGDAAHAMTPNLGQGGNQALEDAVTLAAFVTGGNDAAAGTDIAAGLARYDSVRRARTTPIARRSRQLGRIAQADGPLSAALRNALIRMTPAGSAVRAAREAPELGTAGDSQPAGREPCPAREPFPGKD